MPDIILNILARINQANLRKDEQEMQQRWQRLGQQLPDELTKGIEKAAPNMRRAMNSAADATVDYTRKLDDLKKKQDDYNASLARATQLEGEAENQRDRLGQITKTTTALEENLKSTRREQEGINKQVLAYEGEIGAMRQEHSETVRDIHDREQELFDLREAGCEDMERLGGLETELQRVRLQSKHETDDLRDAEWILGQTRDDLGVKTADLGVFEAELDEIRKEHKRGVQDLDSTEKELGRTREAATKTDQDIIRSHDDVDRVQRRREESLRRLIETERKADDDSRRGSRGGGFSAGGALRGILPGGQRAGAGAYAIAAPLVGNLAEAAVTSSQSLALLPAIAAAGGAALLTLTIGFDGLGKALKDVGDPKKFAKDLESLGPAAQQVALEVQFLTEGPLKELKAATEESLFKGVPETLHNLTNTLLPQVKQLTTGVGDAFNGMFQGLAGQLTTPESLKSIGDIVNNIVTAFHNLEPAVAPFVDALTKITQTGSSFLPGFANSIADAARSFDEFITKAQQSGDLQKFIREGVDAAKALGSALADLGGYIYQVFGHKEPGEFKQTLDDMVQTLLVVGNAIEGAAQAVNEFLKLLQSLADHVGGYDHLFEAAFAFFITGKFISVLTSADKLVKLFGGEAGLAGVLKGLPAVAETSAKGIEGSFGKLFAAGGIFAKMLPFMKWGGAIGFGAGGEEPAMPDGGYTAQEQIKILKDHPELQDPDKASKWFQDHPKSGAPTGGPTGSSSDPGWKPTLNTNADIAAGPGKFRRRDGSIGDLPSPATAGLDPYHPFAVPDASDYDSDSKKKAAAKAALDPSKFAVNPFEGLPPGAIPSNTPGGPGMPPIGGPGSAPGSSYGPLQVGTNGKPYQKPGLGYQSFNDEAVLNRMDDLQKDAWKIQDAQMDLEALKQSGVATQKELLDAEHKVTEEKMALGKDQRALLKDEEGHWNKVKSDIKDLGPGLDPDLGLGQGLAGFMDNMVRFAGSMAMAPVLAGLQQQIDADPIKGGYGMLGVRGAENISNGLSPLLGRPYTGVPSGFNVAGPLGSQFGVGPGSPADGSGSGYAGDAALLSNVPSGSYQWGGADLAHGLADCSGAVGNLANVLAGNDQGAGGKLNTGNASTWLPAHGFLPGSMPGAFNVGYNAEHMQATLPGGTNFNWGSDAAAKAGGVAPNAGAFESGFTDHWYRPVDGSPGGAASFAGGPAASGATPVYVVNMPGGGMGAQSGGIPAANASNVSFAGGGPGPAPGGIQSWLNQQLLASGLSPDESKGILAMNSVEGGAKDPKSLLGFTEGQAQGPAGHLQAFLKQWNDPKRRGGGGSIPGVGPDGSVNNWDQYMTWIREKIVGQTGATSDWQGNQQPPASEYQSNLMKALGAPVPGGAADLSDIHMNGSMGGPGGFATAPVFNGTGNGGGAASASGTGSGSAYPPPFPGLFPPVPIGSGMPGGGPANPPPAPGVPGTDLFAPGGVLGGAPPGSPGIASLDPNNPAGTGQAPGQYGPFPVPPGVAPGGVGHSAFAGLGPGTPGTNTAPTPPVGRASGEGGWQSSGAGAGADGGLIGSAAGAAASALDVIAPGAGQAAQTATKLINRGIQFGGQLASIGVSGLMQTFLPSGSALGDPSKSWFGRLAAGLSGARPATPGSAGQTQAPLPPQVDPNTTQHGDAHGAPPGPTVNIEHYSPQDGQSGQATANDIAFRMHAAGTKR